MVILEGTDGGGKTTLLRELCDTFGFKVGERGVADRKLLYTVTRQDTYKALSQAVRGDQRPVIWDRLFFSEMVYAPVVGRPCEFGRREQQYVQDLLYAMGVPVIVCLPPLAEVRENIKQAEQMKGVNENIANIHEAYFNGNLGWPEPSTLFYDYTGIFTQSDPRYGNHAQVLALVSDYLNDRTYRETY